MDASTKIAPSRDRLDAIWREIGAAGSALSCDPEPMDPDEQGPSGYLIDTDRMAAHAHEHLMAALHLLKDEMSARAEQARARRTVYMLEFTQDPDGDSPGRDVVLGLWESAEAARNAAELHAKHWLGYLPRLAGYEWSESDSILRIDDYYYHITVRKVRHI